MVALRHCGLRLAVAISSTLDRSSTRISARACSIVTPGFSRPISPSIGPDGASPGLRPGRGIIGSIAAGTHRSELNPTRSPKNPRGATPITRAGTPSSTIVLFRIDGSRLNRVCQ